jgi:HEAT repeat protein
MIAAKILEMKIMKKASKDGGYLNRQTLQSYLKRLPARTKQEELTREELENVASDLTNPDDLFLRISVLAKSFDPLYIPAFEKLLTSTQDPDVAGVALRALIDYHGKLEYIPILTSYIDDINSDGSDTLKLRSIHIANALLQEHEDPVLIKSLIKQFENSENEIVREAAHEALMSAAGIDRRDIATRISARGFSNGDLRLDVIEKLKKTSS